MFNDLVARAVFVAALLALNASCGSSMETESHADTRCEALNVCLCADPGCQGPAPVLGSDQVVVPSPEFPDEAVSQVAHNNLDIIHFRDRLFFAYRTAPSHFASPETFLYVVSTADHATWRYEGAFFEGSDLREPRFMEINDTLFLYYARLGADRFAFEPGVSRRSIYRGPGDWSEPEDVFEAGFIPWRFKAYGDAVLMIGYTGGDTIYSEGPSRLRVHWLQTSDGDTWRPVVDQHEVVLEGGVSETDFVFRDDGSLVAVGRNEAGDEGGFGSRVCAAPAEALHEWRCRDDPRKFDSPLLFRHRDEVYLIGRRTVTASGHYDVSTAGTLAQRRLVNQAENWQTPKRCALWRVDPSSLDVVHLLDLPTSGDTCFASVLPLGGGQYLIYDYRSADAAPGIGWLDGQTAPTEIYRVTLGLP